MKVYPGSSLVGGDQTKEFTAMRQGVIDMAVGSTINWSPQVQELNLFSMPFLMPDYKAIDALTSGEVGKKLFEIIGAKDVVPLAWGENGFRELTNSKRAIRTPDDLKGLKIRVVGSPIFNDTFTALGANPTQMSWADAQPALSTGAVDGQENPMHDLHCRQAAHSRAEIRDAVALCGRSADLLGQQATSGTILSQRISKIVREAAVEAAKHNIELARKGVTPRTRLSMLKDIGALGVEIAALSRAEKSRRSAPPRSPVYDKWKARIGADLVTRSSGREGRGRKIASTA